MNIDTSRYSTKHTSKIETQSGVGVRLEVEGGGAGGGTCCTSVLKPRNVRAIFAPEKLHNNDATIKEVQ